MAFWLHFRTFQPTYLLFVWYKLRLLCTLEWASLLRSVNNSRNVLSTEQHDLFWNHAYPAWPFTIRSTHTSTPHSITFGSKFPFVFSPSLEILPLVLIARSKGSSLPPNLLCLLPLPYSRVWGKREVGLRCPREATLDRLRTMPIAREKSVTLLCRENRTGLHLLRLGVASACCR